MRGFDELIRRTEVIAHQYPQSEALTLTSIREAPAVMGALRAILKTAGALGDVMGECAQHMQTRRDPILRFVERIEAEGFTVADDWTLTDTRTWSPVGATTDPDLLVQREAEKITRTERATAYHERLKRMADAFEDAVIHCAQQIRNLIPSVLDG